jgi:hypothetical protein
MHDGRSGLTRCADAVAVTMLCVFSDFRAGTPVDVLHPNCAVHRAGTCRPKPRMQKGGS